jgi:hypothetical protein
MGTEQLYFIIGVLLGSIFTGCLLGVLFALWYETYHHKIDED